MPKRLASGRSTVVRQVFGSGTAFAGGDLGGKEEETEGERGVDLCREPEDEDAYAHELEDGGHLRTASRPLLRVVGCEADAMVMRDSSSTESIMMAVDIWKSRPLSCPHSPSG